MACRCEGGCLCDKNNAGWPKLKYGDEVRDAEGGWWKVIIAGDQSCHARPAIGVFSDEATSVVYYKDIDEVVYG